MHDGGGDRRETLRALPSILRALQRRHFEVVTLSRMFATAPPASAFWSGSFEGGDARSLDAYRNTGQSVVRTRPISDRRGTAP